MIANLIYLRAWLTVRLEKSVTVEVIVGRVIAVVVTSVGIYLSAIGLLLVKSLINEVPDISTLELRVLTHEVPIVAETAARVTHSVRILTLDKRLLVLLVLRVFLRTPLRKIHRTENIRCITTMTSLILHRTAWVNGLYPIVCSLEVLAVTCLVTKTPNNDCRVIAIYVDIVLVTLKDRLCKQLMICKRILVIEVSVTLDVSLSSHIDAIFITKVIPYRIIRIVTGTNGIDIKLLHALDVQNHTLTGNDITAVRIKLVTVHALDIYRLAIDKELRVLDFHLTETDFCYSIAIRIINLYWFLGFLINRGSKCLSKEFI